MPEFMMTMINTFLMNLSDNTNFILIQMNEKRKKKNNRKNKALKNVQLSSFSQKRETKPDEKYEKLRIFDVCSFLHEQEEPPRHHAYSVLLAIAVSDISYHVYFTLDSMKV